MSDTVRREAGVENTSSEASWWQRGVIYQIYPRSFQDSDGDGVGDLTGIRARLDHLVELGVDALWISPIYPSPMADFGYDVADYCDVDPVFGTLADFDELLEAAHARGLKVLLDFVPSHTSAEHPWFLDSRRARSSRKRDWYIWRDAAPDGGPPNNWLGEFGGSAWEWDEATGQYYLHLFLAEQPSLNWRNPELRDAMHEVLRFWFDRGVDGFRVDAVLFLFVDEHFRNNPPDPAWRPGMSPAREHLPRHTAHQPETFEAIKAMRALADRYAPDRLLVAETCSTLAEVASYYGHELDGFHLPFNFELIAIDWQPRRIAEFIDAYEAALPPGAWPNWVCGNHDISRVASRRGAAQARVAAMLLLTLRGTPTIYQGEEIGMLDVPIPPEAVVDPWEKRVPGIGLGRDPARTPLPWNGAPGAGFTAGTPWLPLGDDYRTVNVEAQRVAPDSMLQLHRRLLALRREEPSLSVGRYRRLHVDDAVLVYERGVDGRRLIVALNFTGEPQPVPALPRGTRVRLATRSRAAAEVAEPLVLGPDEGVVLEPR